MTSDCNDKSKIEWEWNGHYISWAMSLEVLIVSDDYVTPIENNC